MTTWTKTAAMVTLAALLAGGRAEAKELFRASERCLSCHNGLRDAAGQDVSFGNEWRPSMMANASRDPYWLASVRREQIDHPTHRADIEAECVPCHMPMPTFEARADGRRPEIFSVLAAQRHSAAADRLGVEGVSCSVCHQIQPGGLGTPATFTGKLPLDTRSAWGARRVFGPFQTDRGRTRVMQSATDMAPALSTHLQEAALCATCHTLFTEALDPSGKVIGALPEQVPFLEWKHSEYADSQSCQDCHMPRLEGRQPLTSVVGQPRDRFFRHVFRGANFFMRRLFARYRSELSVAALPQELGLGAQKDVELLQTETARLELRVEQRGARLRATVDVQSLAGHKIPTAYPSRRMWLHFTVRSGGETLFESGAHTERGNIPGNLNDEDARRFEPHHRVISRPDQVQVYESIMGDTKGHATTGLLSGVRYLKDNRLLPLGFDKATASSDIAVAGDAARDPDFTAGGDRVVYEVDLGDSKGPVVVEAELWYQPIGFRWAQNLRHPGYYSAETARFVKAFESMRQASSLLLASARSQLAAP